MATAKTKMPVPGLIDDTRRAEIIADLNGTMAHLIDLSASAKQAHWNVQGPNFQGLHELFDTITEEVRAYTDEVAERLVALGGTSHGTIQDVVKGSKMKPFPTDERSWDALSQALHERMIVTTNHLRELAASTEDDMGTQDLYIEIIRGLDKRAWMVESHLR